MSSRHLVLNNPESSSGSTQTFPSFQPEWRGGRRKPGRLETESVCLLHPPFSFSPFVCPSLHIYPEVLWGHDSISWPDSRFGASTLVRSSEPPSAPSTFRPVSVGVTEPRSRYRSSSSPHCRLLSKVHPALSGRERRAFK